MKIQELVGGQTIQKGSGVPGEKASAKSNEFQELLIEELARKTDTEKDEGVTPGSTGPVNAPVTIYTESSTSIYARNGNDCLAMPTDAVDSLSGGLEAIDRAMGSGSASLKMMGRMIEKLSLEAEGFRKDVNQLSADHPLKELSDQIGVLAYVESVKWKRGDYL